MAYLKKKVNTVKRGAKKAVYDKKLIHGILDACEICYVAFAVEGKPFVQPINFGRKGETLYMHGSPQNRMTNALIESGEVCLTVALLDSMKLTRSAFHHSVNYRSVVVFGRVIELQTEEEKLEGLKNLLNHFVPNRWDNCRKPDEKELKATRVLAIEIESASAKIADTPLKDNKPDYALDYWSGIIPIKTICGQPIPDTRLKEGMETPQHVQDFYEKHKNGF